MTYGWCRPHAALRKAKESTAAGQFIGIDSQGQAKSAAKSRVAKGVAAQGDAERMRLGCGGTVRGESMRADV